MLDDRPRYAIQEIANELIVYRQQLDYGLLVYLQEGLLKAFIQYPPYLPEQRTELSTEFWQKYTIDTIDLRPRRIKAEEFRISGFDLYDSERQRLESIRNAALKKDPTLIDPSRQVLTTEVWDGVSSWRGDHSIRLLNLLDRLNSQLEETRERRYVVYVTRDEWRSFRDTHFADLTERESKEGTGDRTELETKGKAGRHQIVYWRDIYGKILSRVMLKLGGQPLHDFLGFPSRKALATSAVNEAKESVTIMSGTKLPKDDTVAEELGKLERRVSGDQPTD